MPLGVELSNERVNIRRTVYEPGVAPGQPEGQLAKEPDECIIRETVSTAHSAKKGNLSAMIQKGL